MAGYDPYASLGFKGKKAKKKSDAAARRVKAKRDEAKRQVMSGAPSPGAKAYAQQQKKKGAPVTKKPSGLSRQKIRERELAEVYAGRRRLAKPGSPKPTESNRREYAIARKHHDTDTRGPLEKLGDDGLKVLKKLPVAYGKIAKFSASIPLAIADELDKGKTKQKALAGGVKAVNRADKGLTEVEKKYSKVPGIGKTLGFPSLTELHKGAKSFWYSGNAINAGIYNATRGEWKKLPKEVEKASQGKATYSGKKVIGEKWAKKHGALGTILGGVEEFAAETPAALVGGGSGTAAKQAAREAGRKATIEALEAAVKKAGVKTADDLPKAAREEAEAIGRRMSKKTFQAVAAKKGKGREAYVGVEFKVPFTNRKVSKLAPVGVGNATAAVRKKLDTVEKAGGKAGKVVKKVRDTGNNMNRTVNPYATGRHTSPMAADVTQRQGLVLRGGQSRASDTGHDLAASLRHAAEEAGVDPKSEKEVQEFVAGLLGRVEREGPKSESKMIRELHEATRAPHAAKVEAGLAKEWGGQRLTRHDLELLASGKRAKQGAAQVKLRTTRQVKHAERKVRVAERKEAREQGRLQIIEREQGRHRRATVRYTAQAKKPPAAGRQRLDTALAATAERKVDDVAKTNNELINARAALAAAEGERAAISETHMRSQYKGQQYAVKGQAERATGATGTAKQNIKAIEAADRRVAEATERLAAAEDAYRAAKGMAPAAKRTTRKLARKADARSRRVATATGKAKAVDRLVDPKGHARARVRVRAAEKNATEAREAAVKTRKAAPSNAPRRKAYDDLLKEIAAAPETANLAETMKVGERFAKRAEVIGAPALARAIRGRMKLKQATPPYHSLRKFTDSPVDELDNIERSLASTLTDDTHRVRRAWSAEKAFESGQYDFSPEAVGNAVKSNLTDVAESNYWKNIGRTHANEEVEGAKWYAIGADGLKSFGSKRAAAQHASKQKVETHVRQLTDATVEQLKRQARASRYDSKANPVSRGVQDTVGVIKQVAITTPRTQWKNVWGDTARAIALGGARPFRYAGSAITGTKAMARQRKVARTAIRYAGEVNKGKLSDEAITGLLNKPIKMLYGKGKHKRTVGDLLDEFMAHGGDSSTFVRGEVQTGRRYKRLDKLGDWINYREFAQRFDTFISLRAQGYTADDAVEMTMRAHIDYGHVSPLEEALRRFVAPFIVFRGRNMATYGGKMLRKPGRVPRYITAYDTLAQLAGYEDFEDFEKINGRAAWNLILPLGGIAKGWASSPDPPFNDLYRTYKQVKSADATAIGDSLYFGRVLTTLGLIFTDNKLDTRPLRPVPDSVAAAIKKAGLEEEVRLERKEGSDGKLHWHAHPIIDEIISMNPETGVASRAGHANEGPGVTWANFMTGLGLTKIESAQGELDRISEEIQRLDTRLKDKYGSASSTDAERKAMRKRLDELRARRNEIYAKRGSPQAQKKLKKSSGGGSSFGSGGGFGGGGSFGSSGGF